MQASVKQYAAEVQRTKGVSIHIRVGLNSGEVVVRLIDSDLHMDYTAVGLTTHLAARIEQMAMPGSILIAPEVLRLAEGYVQVTPLGPVSIKGLPEPVAVYEVTGAGPARTWLQAAGVLGLAYALCGRVAEALPVVEEGEAQAPQVRIFDTSIATTALGTGYLLAGRMDEADELGMRPLQAHCHRSLGKFYATIGRHAEARAELDPAIKLYRAMDMTFWLPEAEAALAQVEGR
jgi:tetratricopeptide (TPR) repeat protein